VSPNNTGLLTSFNQFFSMYSVRRGLIPALSVLLLFSVTFGVCAQEAALGSYRLGTGDKIYIQVFDEQDLTMETRVGSSGVINYSFLGTVQVAGQTTSELEQHIVSLLSDGYLVNPSVNVSVVEYRPFFINGEVKSPGGYPYQPGLTMEKAIALAGGLTDRASKRKMYLQKGGQASEQARGKVSMGSKISPGDIITIEEGFF